MENYFYGIHQNFSKENTKLYYNKETIEKWEGGGQTLDYCKQQHKTLTDTTSKEMYRWPVGLF